MSNDKEKEAKLKALKLTLDKMDKTYGKGTVMKMSDQAISDVDAISTGSLGLDLAMGVGGYPRGRVIEIYGPESSGKTTLTLHAIAEAQQKGGIAAFIDAEHAFDRFYAEKLGVDIENLIISQPDNGEQALEITDNLIRSGAIDIIVIDSVAALTPKSEIEGETRVKVVKNKVAPPFKMAEFDIMYGEGISKIGEIIDIGVDYEIVKKSGSWFSYEDTKLGQGRDAVKILLKDNPDLMEELEEKIKNAIKVAKEA